MCKNAFSMGNKRRAVVLIVIRKAKQLGYLVIGIR
jgi:hypothetical protein